jgi:hypothetical protein
MNVFASEFSEYLFHCIFLVRRDWATSCPIPPRPPSAAIRRDLTNHPVLFGNPSIYSGVAKEGGLPNRIILCLTTKAARRHLMDPSPTVKPHHEDPATRAVSSNAFLDGISTSSSGWVHNYKEGGSAEEEDVIRVGAAACIPNQNRCRQLSGSCRHCG